MNPKVEDILKKSMLKLGRAVESIIGHAKKAKVSVAPSHTIQPILAIESQLSMQKVRELISAGADRVVKTAIPNLVDKAVAELSDGPAVFASLMKERGASIVVHVDIGASGGAYLKDTIHQVHRIRASSKNVPFEDGFFDFAVANLATPAQGDIVKTVKEIGRLITVGGSAAIMDFHPFGNFAKKGGFRLRSIESMIRGVEDYYKICQTAGFNLVYIRESFIDETVRTLFMTDEEKYSFRSLKDTPFLIFLFVNKR